MSDSKGHNWEDVFVFKANAECTMQNANKKILTGSKTFNKQRRYKQNTIIFLITLPCSSKVNFSILVIANFGSGKRYKPN